MKYFILIAIGIVLISIAEYLEKKLSPFDWIDFQFIAGVVFASIAIAVLDL